MKLFSRILTKTALAALVTVLLSSCQTGGQRAVEDPILARFAIEDVSSADFAAIAQLPVSGVRIGIQSKAILSEFDYLDIEAVELDAGKCLLFTLKPAAARDFYRTSVANQGSRLVLLLNGKAMGARRIDGPVADGRIYIYIEAPDDQVAALAAKIKETNIDIQKKLSR